MVRNDRCMLKGKVQLNSSFRYNDRSDRIMKRPKTALTHRTNIITHPYNDDQTKSINSLLQK